ncbi:Heme binding peroxidase-like 3 [Hyalella azteca]|uniref:peroxidase n=1 Tax=Hyalella azteca TaxID=294128 RepID=A0A6A0GWB2_HYAAZ|nr:Heme binding peroxidase-like 3 [Hyalella azteca]
MLPQVDTEATVLGTECPTPLPPTSCSPSRFRTLDGTCNNPDQPRWGAANTPFLRLLPAWYRDGDGADLPSAARISRVAHSGSAVSHAHTSLLVPVWAHYLSQDLSRPIVSLGVRGERLRCCGISDVHPECSPIFEGDRCWEYTRTSPATTTNCALGVREQLNAATSFLDGSAIYGSSQRESDVLRLWETGQLKTQGSWLLPRVSSHTCKDEMMCFLGGDLRLNENGGRAALQTMLVRHHNRVAADLATVNPHWGDQTLFDVARSIVGASLQHITYREFLPTLLGVQAVEESEILPLASGRYTGYDMSIKGGIFNSIATGILPLVLTLLPDNLPLANVNLEDPITEMFKFYFFLCDQEIPLQETALNMTLLYKPGVYEKIIAGLIKGKALAWDASIPHSLRHYLEGVDLAARAVHQGRDHGLPPYVVWRPFCRRSPAHTFDQLIDVMEPDRIDTLKRLYDDVADIDLITGTLSERPLDGAMVGPTASCLLSLQFKVLKQTDRYWYENDLPPSSFSKEQLFELRKFSLARLLCDNVPGLDKVPSNPFLAIDPFLNAPVSCDDIEAPNMRAWKTEGKVFLKEELLKEMVNNGKEKVERLRQMEKLVFEKGYVAASKSTLGSAYANNKPNPTSIVMANTSILLEATSQELLLAIKDRRVRRQSPFLDSLNGIDGEVSLPSVDISGLVPPAPLIRSCVEIEEHRPCDASDKFRTISGHCNNLLRPDYGRSNTVFARMLPAAYGDGVSVPRMHSVTGGLLPSPRTVSTNIHYDISHPHARYTLMVMQFGQFLDHDLTFTPLNKGFQNSILDCRDCESPQRVHPECLPITVDSNDPFFPSVNISSGRPFCIAFTRSLPGQQTLGPREQINQNTAYLDASHIYGQELCEARELRTFNGGLLNTTAHPIHGKALLPQVGGHPECKARSGMCFRSGDSRTSEQPGLAVIHTIFMREHNRIATELSQINGHWADERLYQESRRIVSGMWQHIVYNEFLPRVLGWNAMQLYSLRLKPEGYSTDYEPCNPGILNEFASAAFRFGHSLIRRSLSRMDTSFGVMNESVTLRNSFFNPDMLYEVKMVDELVRGLISTPMETLDNFISDEMTNHLFEDTHTPFSGLDLIALNLQRARDHGIRAYNEYRAICNLKRARTFEDFSREIKPELIDKLRRIYKNVEDVDLFTGGLCETPLQGGIIGPTFGCIIGLQFQFLKRCDRFWYETGDQNLRFTENQLAEIRKSTMAALVCNNCDVVDKVQLGVFDIAHNFLNPRIPCEAVPKVDLNLWRDSSTCVIGGVAVSVGETRAASPCTLCQCRANGPQCQTLKVDCFQLRSRVALEDILRDSVCRAQCGNILDPTRPSQGPPQQLQSGPGFSGNAPRDQTGNQGFRPVAGSGGFSPSGFRDGLVPPPPPPPSFQGSTGRARPRPPGPTFFRPPPPPPLQQPSNLRFPFPIPPFLRSLFN